MLILKFQFTKMNSPTFTFLNIVVQDVKWEQCMVKMGRCMLQNLVHHIEQDEVKLEILFQNEIGSIISFHSQWYPALMKQICDWQQIDKELLMPTTIAYKGQLVC